MELRSPLKYVGGKYDAAERIVAMFPDPASYRVYCEPCLGAGHVFVKKPMHGHREVVGDKDGNVVAFWRTMQTDGEALAKELHEMPIARQVYYECYRSLFDGTELTQYERAKRWFYALRFTGTGWMRESPVGWNNLFENAYTYRRLTRSFELVRMRMNHVLVDNRDVLDTVRRYDSEETFTYLDPPYFGTEMYYSASKNGFPHGELAELLSGAKGKVAVSYYEHPQLDVLYDAKWHRHTWSQQKHVMIQESLESQVGQEVLLTNYDIPTFAHQGLWGVE